MNNTNRDLLLLLKQELKNPQAIERQVSWLHGLLYSVEKIENLVPSHELIDVNRFKVIRNAMALKLYMRSGKTKPFVFLSNRN